MDAISAILRPYTATIGSVAGIITSGQMLSASLLLNDIRKHGAVRKTDPILPYVGGLVMSVIGLRFGFAIADDSMIRTNFFGFALHVLYVSFFYWYTPAAQKQKVWRQIGMTGAVAAGVLAYAAYEDERLLAGRLGMVMFTFIFMLVGMPFLGLREIIRTRSVAGLPFPLIASGTAVSGAWTLHALCLNNGAMVAQNAILFVMSLVQLSLFVIYPAGGETKAKKTKAAAKKSQ